MCYCGTERPGMTKLSRLSVKRYRAERIPNPSPTGETSFDQFHTVRNAIVHVCQRHGGVAGLGAFDFHRRDNPLKDWRAQLRAVWGSSDANAKLHVIDDQYNDELYQYMEILDPAAC